MKNKILVSLNLILLMSCTSNSQDLSIIDFNKNAETYLDGLTFSSKTEQKGHYEAVINGEDASLKLIDKGEVSTNYVFMGENTAQLNYGGLAINDVMGSSLNVYEDKIAFMRINVKNEQSIALLDLLKKKLRTPTEIIKSDNNHYDETDKSQRLLLDKLPNETKKIKDDLLDEYYLTYPEHFIWDKNEVIYQLTFSPTGSYVTNQLVVISKKALKDKIIIGFHNTDKDSILSKYMNLK